MALGFPPYFWHNRFMLAGIKVLQFLKPLLPKNSNLALWYNMNKVFVGPSYNQKEWDLAYDSVQVRSMKRYYKRLYSGAGLKIELSS